MNSQIPEWVKPGLWGAVVGAVALAIIGFSAGWVMTSGSAQQMAKEEKDKAVIAALTPICVAKFKGEPEAQKTSYLAALEEEDSWKREDYVSEHGWATMPGSTDPNDEVADACASELMKLVAK